MIVGEDDTGVADIPLAKAWYYLIAALEHLDDSTDLEKFYAAQSEVAAAQAAIQEGIERLQIG